MSTGMATSKAQKKRNGTYRKDRDVRIEIQGETLNDIPEIIFKDKNAESFYKETCRILLRNGWLLEDFMNDIIRASDWYAIYSYAKTQPMMQTTKTGYTAITAHFTLMKESQKNLVDFENRYGLNLLSSQRFEKKKVENDPFDKLMNG